MHEHVGVTADRGREVGVQGNVESIVAVLGDVEHASAEVLRALSSLRQEDIATSIKACIGIPIDSLV